MSYYDKHADIFIADTLHVDMTPVYKPFLKVFSGKSILDIGCGPGRDLKYFGSLGYDITGLEPSPVLAKFAKNYSSAEVIESSIQNLIIDRQFDAVWACASLLHVPSNELEQAFNKIAQVTKCGGVIYCSFKHGDFEGERNGRFFNFRTLDSLKKVLPSTLSIMDHWITGDQRVERNDEWLNVLISRI